MIEGRALAEGIASPAEGDSQRRGPHGWALSGTPLCLAYGVIHALVDAVTVTTLFAALANDGADLAARWAWIVAYNAIAFGAQAPLGWMADVSRRPRTFLCAGIVLAGAGVLLACSGFIAGIAVGAAGNAFFHIGAGALSIEATPGRTAGPGVFVAPGAIGLGLGGYLGGRALFPVPAFVILLACSFIAAIVIRPTTAHAAEAVASEGGFADRMRCSRVDEVSVARASITKISSWIGVVSLFIAVVLRAVIGTTSKWMVEPGIAAIIALSLAAATGKAAGGITADRAGRIAVAVPALLVSAPLLAFSGGNLILLAIGSFFFQAVMSITLVSLADAMPRWPGLAFGLNCLALFLGFLVTAFRTRFVFQNSAAQLAACFVAAAAAIAGVLLILRRNPRIEAG